MLSWSNLGVVEQVAVRVAANEKGREEPLK